MPTGAHLNGRPKGVLNKVTRKFKDAIMRTYDGIGGDDAFMAWAQEYPTEFYKLCSKLIPVQDGNTGGQFAGGVTIVIGSVDKSENAGLVIDQGSALVERGED